MRPTQLRIARTSAETLVLGLVLAAARGRTVSDFASEKLWQPLGAEANAAWRIDESGQEFTSCCFGAHSGDLDQPFQRIPIKRSGRTRSVVGGA